MTGFIHDVSQCWNITQADDPWPVIEINFELTREGVPLPDSFVMTEASAASETATQAAFASARRAVLRCGMDGYDLPAEHFELWQHVAMTVDPTQIVRQ
ncbi:hypothetical protein Q4555_14835 [Octadecabacter sp. 1_MG-2023]|uniref:hypothetical protein n=1 Tax=unclassified Octadecabacter TaxID=196158 RepID=UPI001C094C7B|nr:MULTISPECIES: hypothetical protein [unclassified Octadecabacter]MBU2991978.1 hypothetical protein [Octadecabacter sp. B2R22]MDO6735952.1 hypothetical protein [Octadecabacter sp. 1_MG-2023]